MPSQRFNFLLSVLTALTVTAWTNLPVRQRRANKEMITGSGNRAVSEVEVERRT